MNSIRLYNWQMAMLPKGNGAKTIERAIFRFRCGDFGAVIPQNVQGTKTNAVLQVFPLRRKPRGFTDAQIRDILTAHLTTPDIEEDKRQAERNRSLDKEISKWDGIIAEMMGNLPPFTIEGEHTKCR